MSNQVGAYEAKTHLPALLERVARGEEITIPSTAGRSPGWFRLAERDRIAVAKRSKRLKKFAESHTLDVPLKRLISEGRQ